MSICVSTGLQRANLTPGTIHLKGQRQSNGGGGGCAAAAAAAAAAAVAAAELAAVKRAGPCFCPASLT